LAGLRELPEPQRAAIVMRELEGLSHEQIAASLGLSGGAVRQSIYRARRALRDAAGMLVPMPLLRQLLEEGFTQGASAAAAGGGAGIAVKTGVAALLAAGTLTTGAVINHELKSKADATSTGAKVAGAGGDRTLADLSPNGGAASTDASGRVGNSDRGGSDDSTSGHRGSNSGPGSERSGTGSSNPGSDDSHSGSGSSDSGSGKSESSGSGSSGSESSGSGSSGSGSSGSESSGSGSGTSGGDRLGGGSDDPPELDDH
jgi:hypothetical protein